MDPFVVATTFLFLAAGPARAFNLATDKPIWASSDRVSSAADYFSYSMALDPQNSILFVGAPGYETSGAVFKCPFQGSNPNEQTVSCSRIAGEGGSNRDFLGGSLTMYGSDLLLCSPRYNSQFYATLQSNTGTCSRYNVPRRTLNGVFNLTSPRFSNAGWSMLTMMGHDMTVDDDGNMVMGIPMARTSDFSWNSERTVGSLLRYRAARQKLDLPRKSEVGWGVTTHSTPEEPHTYDLTGTAIARGRFMARSTSKTDYALGAPKANKLRGRIYICPNCFGDLTTRSQFGEEQKVIFANRNNIRLDGTQFGARFGQTLAAVDINGDGFDDLVVGAPLFSEREDVFDSGRVYVYKSVVEQTFTELRLMSDSLPRKIVSGARFGATIENLGDIDQDGFQDFAVAAPFEDDKGAVYVYRGSQFFTFADKPDQKLTAADFNVPLGTSHTFGISLSGGEDLDGNGHTDLAIGIMNPGKSVILRSRESIRLKTSSYSITPDKAVNPEDQGGFQIKVRAFLLEKMPKTFRLKLSLLNIDTRISLPSELFNNETEVEFAAGKSFRDFDLKIDPSIPNFGVDPQNILDIPRPIWFHFKLEWTLPESTENCPALGCPMFDPRYTQIEEIKTKVDLQSGCTDPSSCKCDLDVVKQSSFQATPIKVVVGKQQSISTRITVRNKGNEPSYNTHLIIISTKKLGPPSQLECSESTEGGDNTENNLGGRTFEQECKFPSLNKGKFRNMDLDFDISDLEDDLDLTHVDIELKIVSSCSPRTQNAGNDMTMKTRVEFTYETNIKLTGLEVGPKQLEYNETIVAFAHTFKITNEGPSPLNKDLHYTLYVPDSGLLDVVLVMQFKPGEMPTRTGRIYTGLSDTTAGSRLVSCGTSNCFLYKCVVEKGKLKKDQSQAVELRMQFRSKLANADHNYLRYYMRTLIKTPEAKTFVPLTTEFYAVGIASAVKQTIVPYIVGAVIAALLLLFILAVLWKSGAFGKMRIFQKKMDDALVEK